MKMEDHFKESLNRAVANEPPVLDAWDRFERRAHRGRNVRLFASALAAAAVIVAAVIVVPKLGTGGGGLGLATQPPSPSPTPTATATQDPYAGWVTYDYDDFRFKLKHPKDWRETYFEHAREILAPGQPGTAAGDPTAAVTLELLSDEFDGPEWRSKGFDRSTRPDGRPFVWTETRLPEGGKRIDYRFEWSSCVTGVTESGCVRTPQTLVVMILASTGDLWDKYGSTAELIVASIEYDGPLGPYPA